MSFDTSSTNFSPMGYPDGKTLAQERYGDDIPECPECGAPRGTNGQCIGCIYTYEGLIADRSPTLD
jgi:hypothetical protein